MKREIWLLDDARATCSRIPRFIAQKTKELVVRVFNTRLEMEAAWQAGRRPVAIVLDLLVLDKHFFLAQLLLLRNAPGWRCWIGYIVSPFVRLFVRMLPSIFPSYLAKLEGDLMTGTSRFWGGVEFLRTRLRQQDLSVPVYVYSIAANEVYREGDHVFGPQLLKVHQLVERDLMPELGGLVRIFPKGFYAGNPWDRTLVHDGFAELFGRLRSDLKIA